MVWLKSHDEQLRCGVGAASPTFFMEFKMNKKLLIGAGIGCAIAAGIAGARKKQTEPQESGWDKMRKGMEQMPEDFPPRIMYDNIEVTKANTEEILTFLRTERTQADKVKVDSTS